MNKLNKLSIKFDKEKFNHDLCDRLVRCVYSITNEIELMMKFEAKSTTVRDGIKTIYDFDYSAVVNYGIGLIETKVGSSSWKAFQENYGTGSKMNVFNNPDFDKYFNSEYWNPLRGGKTVVGRPEGWYKTLDWDSANPVKEVWRYSYGTYAGENLEETKMTMPNSGTVSMFSPQEGTLFMNNAFEAMKKKFEKSIIEVINSLNLNDYLITGK